MFVIFESCWLLRLVSTALALVIITHGLTAESAPRLKYNIPWKIHHEINLMNITEPALIFWSPAFEKFEEDTVQILQRYFRNLPYINDGISDKDLYEALRMNKVQELRKKKLEDNQNTLLNKRLT
ncbi:hypothetical protein AB6A40_005639 [Gnathostoma spinigerum]|uniref:Uncharacterized protein n=1 Tax=Gnathostoma spinigerum TaxID=75299 RepID=A0ABD6ERN9_9BILA